jgi:hypothetical protein
MWNKQMKKGPPSKDGHVMLLLFTRQCTPTRKSNSRKMKEVPLYILPRKDFDIDIDKHNGKQNSPRRSSSTESSKFDSEGKPAMVILGCCTEEVAGGD